MRQELTRACGTVRSCDASNAEVNVLALRVGEHCRVVKCDMCVRARMTARAHDRAHAAATARHDDLRCGNAWRTKRSPALPLPGVLPRAGSSHCR